MFREITKKSSATHSSKTLISSLHLFSYPATWKYQHHPHHVVLVIPADSCGIRLEIGTPPTNTRRSFTVPIVRNPNILDTDLQVGRL
jgi:hypothetical protein